jgi:maleylacetoacetate isomerase
MRVRLFQDPYSSSSARVRWALAIKRVPHEVVIVDLSARENDAADHRARSPLGYVPVLEIDGRCLSESVAIIEHLETLFPDPALYPREAWARARVREMVSLVCSGIQPLQNPAVRTKHAADRDDQHAWARFFNERGLAAYERLVLRFDEETGARGTFSAGDALTAADLFLVPQLASARRFGVALELFPRLLELERSALATAHAHAALAPNG